MTEITNWVLIPPVVLADERLSSTDKMIYGKALGLSNQKGYCFASNDYIGEHIGVSKESVKKSLQKLYKYNLLTYTLIRDKNKQVKERRIYPTLGENATLGGVKGMGSISPTSIKEKIKVNRFDKKELEKGMQNLRKAMQTKGIE